MSELQTQPKRGLSKTQVILIAGFLVILLALGAVVYLLLSKKEAPALPTATPGTGNIVMDEGFDPEAFKKKAAENMFEVKMSNLWTFPDGASAATDSYVANAPANSLPFYFEIALSNNDKPEEKETLYTSPVIPVGSAVRDVTLSRDLDKGLYEAECIYYNLNPDNTVESTLVVVVRLDILA